MFNKLQLVEFFAVANWKIFNNRNPRTSKSKIVIILIILCVVKGKIKGPLGVESSSSRVVELFMSHIFLTE